MKKHKCERIVYKSPSEVFCDNADKKTLEIIERIINEVTGGENVQINAPFDAICSDLYCLDKCVKANKDCSDAEKSLKECLSIYLVEIKGENSMAEIKQYKTVELVEELKTREAVQEIKVEPHTKFCVVVNGKEVNEIKTGPARVFVVWD